MPYERAADADADADANANANADADADTVIRAILSNQVDTLGWRMNVLLLLLLLLLLVVIMICRKGFSRS